MEVTKLKTLNDFEDRGMFIHLGHGDNKPEVFIHKDSLKQEAIEWIKELDRNTDSTDAMAWIKMFFNLDEKDLCEHDIQESILVYGRNNQIKCHKCKKILQEMDKPKGYVDCEHRKSLCQCGHCLWAYPCEECQV